MEGSRGRIFDESSIPSERKKRTTLQITALDSKNGSKYKLVEMFLDPPIFILHVLVFLALPKLLLSLNVGANCVITQNVPVNNLTYFQKDFMIDSILVNQAHAVTNATVTLSKCIYFDIDSPRAAPSNTTIFGTSVTTRQSTINGCTAIYNNTKCLT